MNRELENALVERYPAIYRSLQPRFSGGIRVECDDGWYRIIDELSRKLDTEARVTGLAAIEVRERLGSLRFRLRGHVTITVDSWLGRGYAPEPTHLRTMSSVRDAAWTQGWSGTHALPDLCHSDGLRRRMTRSCRNLLPAIQV
jgi:hypothetical protein